MKYASAYKKGLVTQRERRVQQIQFRVFWPDGLIGSWWVLYTNHVISGGLRILSPKSTRPGTEKLCSVIRHKV